MDFSLPNFHNAKVLVVGDVMLDRYWQGPTSRISPEAPVPVVNIKDTSNRAGGAANVALNLAALKVDTKLIGLVGKDENGKLLEEALTKQNIASLFAYHPSLPTITKLRVLSRNQQILRLDFEENFHGYDASALEDNFQQQLEDSQVVILSDYGKGTLANPQPLIQAAKQAGKFLLIDPKGTDFSRYKGASLITPNLSEFEAVVGKCTSEEDLEAKAKQLINQLDLQALLITRSEAGMTLITNQGEKFHQNTRAREVFDVTGAGDTVIAVLAASLAAGSNLENAMQLANAAAGLVVAKLGTASVSTEELRRELRKNHQAHAGIFCQAELLIYVEEARKRGETLVMTNGCFDILHPGHVQYLQEAKNLGDRLLVAVNSDASVSRLKGPNRPINLVEHRMAVLAGLESVDWVTAFEQDTPEEIICQVLPDILVKGGDYQVEEIAGHKCVIANGGQVKILSFKDNCSTSAIVEKITSKEVNN